MQRVVRSTLVGLLAVAGLTACGDKVTPVTLTTTTSPTPTPVVHSVTVSPASVTLNVGGTAQLAASVDADAGITDRTVTWTSSDATIATVTSAGVVTAVKAGSATIIASAKAAPTVQGAAAVTVSGGGSVVPTVTISGYTTTICSAGGVCSTVGANLQNFGTAGVPASTGQLDVALNVDSQNTPLKSVSATIKCGTDSVTQIQNVSGAAAPIGAEASTSPITFSFNTAAFNPTSGVAALHNGACTISASAATAAGTQSASTSQTLTLNNADVIIATSSATKGPANDGTGLSWVGGDVKVNVVPVFYTAGRSAVSGVITLGGTIPATGTAATASTQSLTTFPGTVTFAAATAPGAGGGVKGETINPVTITASLVDNSGNSFAPGLTITGPTRLDNQAPVAGAYAFNLQGANNNWVGSTYTFSTKAGNGYVAAVPAGGIPPILAGTNNDLNGVDNVTVAFQYSPHGAATWTTISKATDIPASNVNSAYDLRMIETDALGNATTTAIGGTFGVDLNAPTVTLSGTLAANTVSPAAAGTGTTTATVTDDFSGPFTTFMAITRQNTSVSTNATECVLGTASTSSSHATDLGALPTYNADGSISGYCTPAAVGVGTQTHSVASGAGDGYYVISAYGTDQAGNKSAASTRSVGEDATAPTQGGVAIPASFTGGAAATFPTSSTDNMDLVRSDAVLVYPGAAMNLYYSNALPGVAFDNVLTNSASYSFTIPNFISSLQFTTAGAPQAPAGDRPTQLTVTSVDEAGNVSAPQNAAFGAATFSTATAYNANVNFTSWTSAASKVTVSDCPSAGCAGGVVPANPTATTLTGVAAGPTGVFNIPFSSVTFYYQVGGAGAWYPIGTVTAPTATDDGTASTTARKWTYTLSWTPPKSTPQAASLTAGAAISVVAIGQDAAGNALVSAPVAITLTNP